MFPFENTITICNRYQIFKQDSLNHHFIVIAEIPHATNLLRIPPWIERLTSGVMETQQQQFRVQKRGTRGPRKQRKE